MLNPEIGETWRHTQTGASYRVTGFAYNTITDCVDVLYTPLVPGPFGIFSRQLSGGPKAWLSINEDGTARFEKV